MILRRKLKAPFLKIKWKFSEWRREKRIVKRQYRQIEELYKLQKEVKARFLEAERKKERDCEDLKKKLKILDWVLGYIDEI